jgi:hypothetical protein
LLLFHCCPATISGLVVTVLVRKTVDAISVGTLSHISQEILERLPPLANFDASPRVAVGIVRVGLSATPPHFNPDSMRQRLIHSMAKL